MCYKFNNHVLTRNVLFLPKYNNTYITSLIVYFITHVPQIYIWVLICIVYVY